MNCYNHQTVAAVATCKNCSKGLCPECLSELKNGIACKATCVEEVESINAMIQNNKGLTKRAASNYYRTTFIYLAMGLFFIFAGFIRPWLKFYMLPMGGLFVFIAILTFSAAKKYKKDKG